MPADDFSPSVGLLPSLGQLPALLRAYLAWKMA
jgi:hypothetical protein